MHVRLGVPVAQEHGEPAVYDQPIHTGEGGHDVTVGADVNAMALHLARNTGPVTHLPGNEAFVNVVQTFRLLADGRPATWASVKPTDGEDPAIAEDFERQLASFYECPRGIPDNVEETHWTTNSAPPGVDSGQYATAEEA